MQVFLVVAGLSLLVLWHEAGHALCARWLGLRVTNVSIGLGPALMRRVWRGIDVTVGLLPFGGFVRVRELAPGADAPDRFRARHAIRRIAVIVAGSVANFALAAVLMTGVTAVSGKPTGRIDGLEVTAVSEPARAAGLQVGDVVVSVNGAKLERVRDLQQALARSAKPDANVEVLREGRPATLTIAAQQRGGRRGLGARYVVREQTERVGWGRAVMTGLAYPAVQSARLLENAALMLVPESDVRPVGPVGIADRVAKSGDWDARRVVSFAALLAVVVGLFNLLPAPGLDGGRALLEVIETTRRRRVPPKIATTVQVVGVMILLGLWGVLFAWDARAWILGG